MVPIYGWFGMTGMENPSIKIHEKSMDGLWKSMEPIYDGLCHGKSIYMMRDDLGVSHDLGNLLILQIVRMFFSG